MCMLVPWNLGLFPPASADFLSTFMKTFNTPLCHSRSQEIVEER